MKIADQVSKAASFHNDKIKKHLEKREHLITTD